MKKILEASELPENDKVYLIKDTFGYKIVKPIKKELTKPYSFNNIHWPNLLFGGWRNLAILLFILAIIMYHFHEDKLNLENARIDCENIYSNPNGFCAAACSNDLQRMKNDFNYNPNILLNLTDEG